MTSNVEFVEADAILEVIVASISARWKHLLHKGRSKTVYNLFVISEMTVKLIKHLRLDGVSFHRPCIAKTSYLYAKETQNKARPGALGAGETRTRTSKFNDQ